MPMIDVYAAAGTFPDTHQLAVDLATAVMTIEQVPDIPMFRQNTAAFDASAILYRRTASARAEFVRSIAGTLKAIPSPATSGWLGRALIALSRMGHPRDWLVCSKCAGTGRVYPGIGHAETRIPCSACRTDGFKPNEEK